MTRAEFKMLLRRLADAWTARDYESAASCFVEDVHYCDPTRYSFTSRSALLEFFQNDEGYDQQTFWHRVLFDEDKQQGVAEYTYEGTHRYHGAVLIELRGNLISDWREYQHVDPHDWESFVAGPEVRPRGHSA